MEKLLHRLLEKNTNFTIPLAFGDAALAVGTVLDVRDPEIPTIGHLGRAPFNLTLPPPTPTGLLDIDLSLVRTVEAQSTAGASGAAGGVGASVQAGFTLKHGRDVAVSVEPAIGEKITDLLSVATQLRKHPAWDHGRYAFVFRTFYVAKGEVHIAKDGGGEITLKGSADAVSRVLKGHLDGGVTWTTKNVYTKSLPGKGIFGVHCVHVRRNGKIKVM